MKLIFTILTISWLFSCNSPKLRQEKSKDYFVIPARFPLNYVQINNSTLETNIPIDSFNKEVNDLKIDTSNNQLWVSFDIRSTTQYAYEAKIGNYNSRIYLIYFLEDLDTNRFVIKGDEFRIFYNFTDIASYKNCNFLPMRKRVKFRSIKDSDRSFKFFKFQFD